MLMAATGYSQDILGKWVTEAGDAQVEIYQAGDKLNGKIVWLKQGPEKKDSHNPNEKLRSRKLLGVNIQRRKTNGRVVRSTTPRMARTISALSGWKVPS